MVGNDPELALTQGSPALSMLIVALGGAILARALPDRRALLPRPVWRATPTDPTR